MNPHSSKASSPDVVKLRSYSRPNV